MGKVKVVSFDLDGTVTDISFVDSVWLEGIPRLYAVKRGVSFEDAQREVRSEYDKIGRQRLEWYDLNYWIRRLGLPVSPDELLNSFQHRIRVFREVPGVLEELKARGFRLIIVTNARKEFADLELERTGVERCFERVFSSTSDLGLVKKTVGLYRRVCNILNISPGEMVHVGDDHRFDFEVPAKLGVLSFYLDRTRKHSGDFVVHSLKEFSRKLRRLE